METTLKRAANNGALLCSYAGVLSLPRLCGLRLPGGALCHAEWRLRRAGLDYHVEVGEAGWPADLLHDAGLAESGSRATPHALLSRRENDDAYSGAS